MTKSPAQLNADIKEAIADALRRKPKKMPLAVKTAIETLLMEFIAASYRHHANVGGKEPCLTVGLLTDYLRQAHMPEDFRYALKEQQRTWTRSVLEAMRRQGKIGSSFGARARCYEPAR